MWAEGLFIWIGFGIAMIQRAWETFQAFANRNAKPRELKPHWRDMDYNYLEALNELNVMCPTDTEEEKGLARYLEFNDREDHERRQEKGRIRDEQRDPVRTSGTVSGSLTTLLAPGLGNALGGSLGSLGGLLAGQQQGRDSGYLAGLAQQQQLSQLGLYEQLAQQRSMMQPFTAQNNINPLADLAQALRESKKLDS